jgi:hypothetical protein
VSGEFDLIRQYFTHRTRHTLLGVGDDAALIRVRRGHVLAISADMLVEGTHFFAGADPEALGHKTLAVNLSDLAAMGATPRWATLALALPKADARWLAAFSRGFMRLARTHGVDLIGGDTTRGPLNLCVQIMGEVPAHKALQRDGARAGDEVWVSGTLGDAALAVAARGKKIRLTSLQLAAASRCVMVFGSAARAAGVATSKSGISRTKASWGSTSQRRVGAPVLATVNPPNAAGAALSGWPSRRAQSSKSWSAWSGWPVSSLRACRMPSRTVTLLPMPRERGTPPSISQEKGKGGLPEVVKKRSAASATIGGWAMEAPSRTVTLLRTSSAMPSAS